MTSAVPRDYEITWGTFVVGGTTERLIEGPIRVEKGYEAGSISFQVAVRGTSDATIKTNCAEMESEFSKRFQRLQFKIGLSSFLDWNPTKAVGGNTAFNTIASCTKSGTPGADTGRSRLYDVSISAQFPAADRNGKRDISVQIAYTPARLKVVTISGVWTAYDDADASEEYGAQIGATCTTILTAIGGTYDTNPVDENTTRDDQDKTLTFTRVYREKVFNQSIANLNEASIVEDSLVFTRSITQAGVSAPGIWHLQNISAAYACEIDRNSSTDPLAIYTSTVRPHIVAQFEAEYSPNQYALVDEQPGFDPVRNVLSARLTFVAAINATGVVASTISQRIVENSGILLTPAWTGGIFDKYADQGPGVRRRFQQRTVRVLGWVGPKSRVGGGGDYFGANFVKPGGGAAPGTGGAGGLQTSGGSGPSGEGWQLMDNDSSASPGVMGQPDGEQIKYTDLTEQYVEEWITKPAGRGGAGLGGHVRN